jgi:hypothetical protein
MKIKEKIRWNTQKEKGLWRAWLNLNDPNYVSAGTEFHWEIAWLRKVSPGFRIHFGNRGSETPFHWDVSFYWLAFFFSMNTPNMGKFFEKICRGHKRDLSLKFHSGQAWWCVWYDDDGGYDDHHKHDSWKVPKFWPFRNKKYRPWICLRKGNIDLNPLDIWWGHRFYDYETLEEDVLLIEINQFPDDEYMVEFKVQHMTQARRTGPRFARRVTDHGYVADWSIPDGGDGIPTKAPGRGRVYGSAVPIPDPVDWRMDADDALKEWVLDQRVKEGFITLSDRDRLMRSIAPIFDSMQGKLLDLGVAGGQANASLKKFAIELEKRLKKDGGIIIVPENSGMTMTPLDNEELKSKYTPAELAQQAINRDADPRTFFEQVADVQEIVDEANKKED